MRIRCLLFYCLLFWGVPAYAVETITTISCTSTTVPVQVVASLGGGTAITVPATAAVGVLIIKDNSTNCAGSIAGTGYPIAIGGAYDFLPREDGYTGQLCCLLSSGVTAVTLGVNKR